uniref:Endonuclease/exonuclease/phosphatase domain-containing protein n=1 Tax=Cacopsylla melanoneura TaxID=428564 RepID=A0A8D8XJZ5_9HEMI
MKEYNIIRRDRPNQHGGGVCIMVISEFYGQRVEFKENNRFDSDLCEMIWIDIKIGDQDILIAGIYRTGYSQEMDNALFNSIKNHCESTSNNILIFGDFNLHIIENPTAPTECEFISLIAECGLYQMVDQPTRYRTNNTPATLDLILTNQKDLINTITYNAPIGKSDHCVLSVSTQIIYTDSNGLGNGCSQPNFWKANYNEIANSISINYERIKNAPTTIEKTNEMYLILNKAIEDHVPLSKPSNKTNKTPWIDRNIKKLLHKKKKKWKSFKKYNLEPLYNNYKAARNKAIYELRKARSDYESKIIKNGPNAIHKYIRKNLKTKSNNFILKSTDGNLISNPQDVANIFADHFVEVFAKFPVNEPTPLLDISSRSHNELTNVIFSTTKIMNTIKNLKDNGCPGPDCIHPLIMKKCSFEIADSLSDLMQSSMEEGVVPDQWRNAVSIPIFKKGDQKRSHKRKPSL